jgi:hypothetical protein
MKTLLHKGSRAGLSMWSQTTSAASQSGCGSPRRLGGADPRDPVGRGCEHPTSLHEGTRGGSRLSALGVRKSLQLLQRAG